MEALLRIRKLEENRAIGELAKIMRRHNELEAVKERSRNLLDEEVGEYGRLQNRTIDVEMLQMHRLYIDRLYNESKKAQEDLDRIMPEVNREREKVMEASRRRRAVEILKEKYREKYDYEFRKAEKKLLDESNIMGQREVFAQEVPSEKTEYGRKETVSQPAGEIPEPPSGAAEEDGERGPEREKDWLSDYFKKLGVPDPRESGKKF